MTEKTVRPHSVLRRTMLAGMAGVFGGAVLRPTPVQSQAGTAPAVAVPGSAPPAARYGDPGWWAQRKEEILEPAPEIVDPHHHLWDHGGHRCLLDQLLADTGSGHNITQSVFVECGSRYRRRAGGDEAGRRNRIRQWHIGDERKRTVWEE
jgi:hypothetical protein